MKEMSRHRVFDNEMRTMEGEVKHDQSDAAACQQNASPSVCAIPQHIDPLRLNSIQGTNHVPSTRNPLLPCCSFDGDPSE